MTGVQKESEAVFLHVRVDDVVGMSYLQSIATLCSGPPHTIGFLDCASQISIHVFLGNYVNASINSLRHLNAQRCLPQHQD